MIREALERHEPARRGVTSRHAPGPAAGRARRDRQEHDGRRVRRPHRRGRHRADVPRRPTSSASTSCCPTSPTCASAPTTSRRSCSPTGTRTTWARCRSCCASWTRAPPDLRRPAHRGDGALEARRAQAQGRAGRGRAGRPDLRRRPVLGRDGEDGPLDPGLVRRGAHLRARHDARDRRLQVRPDAGGRRARRRRRGWPSWAARACCCCAATRPTPTGPGMSPSESSVGPQPRGGVRPLPRAASWSPASPRTSTACSRWWTPPRRSAGRSRWSGRSMRKNVNIGRMLGHIDIPEGMLVGPKEIEDFPDHKLVVISTGMPGRAALGAAPDGARRPPATSTLHDGDTVIFSATPIPGNERAVNETIDRIYRLGANVITAARRAGARLGPRLRRGAQADAQPDQARAT